MVMRKPLRILIVRTDRMGDVILSTPIIKNLRLAYPDSHIAFMCRPYTRDILAGNPYLNEVIVYDKYGRHKSFLASLKFALSLKNKKFNWAIILHPTNRAHLIAFFAGIPVRAGWDRKLGFLLTRKLNHTKHLGEKHELEYTLDLLKLLRVPVKDKNTFFPLKAEDKDYINKLFSQYNVSATEMVIVIHPSASCPSKRWPQEYFITLIHLLREEFNPRIFLVTAPGEIKYAQSIIRHSRGVIDMRGKLELSQLGALIGGANLFISNDSGPVHIAAALAVPVISIFGRNDPGLSPRRWRPLGKNSFFFHKDTGCRICLAHNCTRGFLCLKAIKPQDVFSKARQIINNEKP